MLGRHNNIQLRHQQRRLQHLCLDLEGDLVGCILDRFGTSWRCGAGYQLSVILSDESNLQEALAVDCASAREIRETEQNVREVISWCAGWIAFLVSVRIIVTPSAVVWGILTANLGLGRVSLSRRLVAVEAI